MRIVQTAFLVAGLCTGLVTLVAVATGTGETALGILWHSIEPRSLNLLQALIHFYIHPALWTRIVLPVLLLPAAAVLAIIFLVAMLAWLVLRQWCSR